MSEYHHLAVNDIGGQTESRTMCEIRATFSLLCVGGADGGYIVDLAPLVGDCNIFISETACVSVNEIA